MNENEYRQVLEYLRQRGRESGLGYLDSIVGDREDRSSSPERTLLLYLELLRERAALTSTRLESRTLQLLREVLDAGSDPLEGIELETDERLRAAFDLRERVPLVGREDSTKAIDMIDDLRHAIENGSGHHE